MQLFAVIPQRLDIGASPTFTGLTITGNSVFGLNSSIFQPATDSTTFFQILDADGGTPVLNVDTTNERVGIGGTATLRKFEIFGSTNTAAMRMVGETGTDVIMEVAAHDVQGEGVIGTFSNHPLILFTNNTDRITISDDYTIIQTTQVGIGGTPTLRKFEIFGSTNTATMRMIGETGTDVIMEMAAHDVQGRGIIGTFSNHPFDFIANNTEWMRIHESGGIAFGSTYFSINPGLNNLIIEGSFGVGEIAPETQLEMTGATPYLTLHNSTHEDSDGGRESRLNFKGEQTGGEETTLARIEVSHDGAADDEKGKVIISINDGDDGDTPTDIIGIDSAGIITFISATAAINGLRLGITTQTNTDYTALATDDFILVSTGATTRTITLPASPPEGKVYHIKKIDSGIGLVTIDGNGNNIDDDATPDITAQYESFSIVFGNSEWNVF